MKLFTNTNHYVELIIAVIFCYTLAIDHDIKCAGPDPELYRGPSVNMVSEIGYVDTIRNDFILPSVGHPLILAIMQTIDFDDDLDVVTYLCFISLVLCYLFGCFLGLKPYLKFIAVLFLNYTLPPLVEWAIEISLLLSIILLWIGIYNFFVSKTKASAVFLGLALLLNILVRPILSPLFYLTMAVVVIAFLFNRKRFQKEAIALAVCATLFFGIKIYSIAQYDDSRLVSGTYSEMPLYCAYNPYIPLEKEYRSYHWKALPDSVYNEAMVTFKLKTTWQDRASLLRDKAIGYITDYPLESWQGYKWRLKRYTINQESEYGTHLFYLWLFLTPFFVGEIKKFTFFKLIVVGLPLYVVTVISVFPYAQIRYLLTPNLYFLCSALLMISYWDKKNLLTEKSISDQLK